MNALIIHCMILEEACMYNGIKVTCKHAINPLYCKQEGGGRMEEMQNQELCILLDSILALLETDNVDKAKEVIQNAINRIDKGMTTSTKE